MKKLEGRIEQVDVQVAQSTSARELDVALQLLHPDSAHVDSILTGYQMAGPAKLISLVQSGFEMPDASARLVSAKHLRKVLEYLRATKGVSPMREQVARILADQQAVLLEHIEQDLEALSDAAEGADVLEQKELLASLHKQLREESDYVVKTVPLVGWQQLPAFGGA